MTTIAPRIDSRLIAALDRLDDRDEPIAETNRRLGLVAEALGLKRPSYEQVRTLVHELRAERVGPGVGETLLEIALRTKPVRAIYAHPSPLGPESAR